MPRFMVNILMKLLYPCREVAQLVSTSLDRELPLLQRLRMRVHFYMCVLCRRYHEQVTFIHDALHRHPERLAEQNGSASPGLPPESRDRIKRALAERQS